MRRRRLKRRLFWASVVFGFVLLYVVASVLGFCVWARDVVAAAVRPAGRRDWA